VGGPKMAIFARGVITPWEVLALRVTGIVPLPLSGPVHSAIHERPSPAGTRSAPQARTISRATQHLLTPRGKIKNGERTPCAPARVVQIERTTLEPFRPSTEGCARRHIRDLQLQDFRGGRSADEQNELDNLKTLYPDLPLDPDDPFTEAIEAWRRVDPKGKSAASK